ncbi:glycerol ABC transporter substrate-binding protein [Halorussus salilacus]|uniref:glycerol ABC transporter substrate-binding protein n=1 Tax=Halorussus salilacus TaxID=2953750 RepID=UPI00209FE9BE|nr:glycerol ABC transporter substrate-binding protein [Halorussus salilacus]USZ68168.1 glycerol ABC transporter substrate-binding protein [Halorussus salilacus]
MSDRNDERRGLRILQALVGLLILLYSVVIASRPLLGIAVVLLLFGAYLAWQFLELAGRFVVAVERIADALENESELTDGREKGPDSDRERAQE